MQFFKPGLRVDFLRLAKPLTTMSLVLVLTSWGLVATKGLNFGIDFAGGTEVLLAFNETVDVARLRLDVAKTGLDQPEVVQYGLTDEGRYFIRSRTQSLLTDAERAKVKAAVSAKFKDIELYDETDETGEVVRVKFKEAKDIDALSKVVKSAGFPTGRVTPQTEALNPVYMIRLPGVRERVLKAMSETYGAKFRGIDRLESVGSAVGKQMRQQGALSVLYALLGILLYISFRFDLRYSPGAVLALIHDVSITVGIFSATGMEFNLPIIAALLAIVGYSLNDTIVVYDRIRESLKLGLGDNLTDSINISVSDCLSRTVLTSVTTFLAVLSIYLFGGGIIENFAFAMLVGVVVGTNSSIYIASPVVRVMDELMTARAEAIAANRAATSRT
jgi:preprotein translocase subunit SecF